ncbi:MAG: CBS domain-containing protein [Nitrospirae bacterium]|nr:CBS domain-containing protein [Nitrospirota bacterium]
MKKIPIKKILTSNVISVPPDTPLSDAVSLMEKNKISCLVVAKNKKPVGILTERDLVVSLHLRTRLDGLSVKDLITGRLVTANVNIDIFEAMDILKTHSIRHLIITDSKGNLAGLITQSDIRNNLGFEYFVEIRQISRIMTKNIVTALKRAYLQDVISRMAEHAISCIVVVEKGYPVGMLTERDIVGLLITGADINNFRLEEVMKSPVLTVHLDAPVHEASGIMNENNIRRLVVVDDKGKCSGLITQSDIVKRFERRYIEILKDIIQEKEEALQKTRKLLNDKIVLDNIMHSSIDMAIVASDLNYSIIYYNPFAEKIYGLKAEKAVGRTITGLFENDTAEQTRFIEAIEKVKKGKDFRYVSDWTKKGTARFVESVLSGIRDRRKQLAGYVLMSRDITERKLADEALQHSEQKYRNFVDNALVGIFQARVSGEVLFVNEALLKIFELESREEAKSGGIIGRFTPPEKITALIKILRESGKVDNFETEIHTKTGSTINVLLSATIEDNVISGVIVDITRARNLEEQLHQSQKMEALGTLTGGIAHEFNNILMIITTCGMLLQSDFMNDDPLRDNIDQIVSAARKASRITQGLLSYTRMSLPKKEPTDINALIEKMSGYLAKIIRKDIGFKTVTTEKPLLILADKAQIEQVIMNLAINALDAMQKKGSLTIRSEHVEIDEDRASNEASLLPGEYALISVTDTGTGIDKAIQTRIFEPFFTTKAIGKGTGIGLSIVYGTLKKHGGRIYVESEPGHGTTFKVYLPLIQSGSTEELAPPRSLEAGGAGTILLAEDDESVMKVIEKVLHKAGYRVISAVNGEEAVRKFRKYKDEINLLLFDVVMPKMNGKDAYEEIKRTAPGMRILFISGYITDDGIENSIFDSGLPFLIKPVSPHELKRKIKEILCI